MKKQLLLLFSMLMMVGMSIAQDVYVSGTCEDLRPAVYRNGEQICHLPTVSSLCKYYSDDMVLDPISSDVYWVVNAVDNHNEYYFGDIFKNNVRYFDSPTGEGYHINKLYWSPNFPNGEDLFAIGTRSDVNNRKYACVWNGSNVEPYFAPEYGTIYESEPYGLTIMAAGVDFYVLYYCGYRALKSDGIPHACIWMNSVCYDLELPPAATGASKALDITNYDGHIVIVGEYTKGTETKGFIWIDREIVFDLGDTPGNSSINKIIVDGGDLYFIGTDNAGCHVWRNEDIYSTTKTLPIDVAATAQGIWYAISTDNGAEVYCNNNLAMTIADLSIAGGLYLKSYCADPDPRPLPYFENFNLGNTDWDCWVVNKNNSAEVFTSEMTDVTEAPYWHRSRAKTDLIEDEKDYYVVHGYHEYVELEDALVSPLLHLDADADSIKLSFLHFMTWGSFIVEPLSVVVYEGHSSEPHEILSIENSTETSWVVMELDLTPFKGKDVRIGFIYRGMDADEWQIDNVLVEAIYNSSPQSYPVTVSCNPEEGSVFGGGDYPAGTNIAISAVANEGFQFKSWQDGVADNPRVVEVNSPMNFFALFERTDIAENGMNPIAVIPNPANTSIRVQGLPKDAVVNIYNTLGTLVKSVSSSREEINISDLAAGVYFINVDHTYVKFMVY